MRLAERLAAQRQPLRDAEAVLLVDDREPQPRQLDVLLEQRVGADRELRLAAGDRRAALRAAPSPAWPPDSQAIVTPQPSSHCRELAVVLLGEDLGRRHERHLPAALDRLQRRERGDDRLAAADVALQQPLHRLARFEVVADLAPDALLRARELERHPREQRAGQRRRCR